jgi:tetratricopeptide (TPR) repeat protein
LDTKTLLEIIATNREDIMIGNNMALNILSALHKNFNAITNDACIMSLALNDSIARMVFHADYIKAIEISTATLQRFPNTNQYYFKARHLGVIGRCHALAGNFAPAEDALLNALAIVEQQLEATDEVNRLIADTLHDLAMANAMNNGKPEESITYLNRALEVLAGLYPVRRGVCLMGIGNVLYGQGKLEEALEYYTKSVAIFDEQSSFANLASAYSNIGLVNTDLGKHTIADSYLLRSLQLRHTIGNTDEIAISYYNLGRLNQQLGNTEKALNYYMHCRDYASGSINKYNYNLALAAINALPLQKSNTPHIAIADNERYKVHAL